MKPEYTDWLLERSPQELELLRNFLYRVVLNEETQEWLTYINHRIAFPGGRSGR